MPCPPPTPPPWPPPPPRAQAELGSPRNIAPATSSVPSRKIAFRNMDVPLFLELSALAEHRAASLRPPSAALLVRGSPGPLVLAPLKGYAENVRRSLHPDTPFEGVPRFNSDEPVDLRSMPEEGARVPPSRGPHSPE